jgi:hypothetical protein
LLLCINLAAIPALTALGEDTDMLQKTDGVITYDAEPAIPQGTSAYPSILCERITFDPEPFLAVVAPGTDPEQTVNEITEDSNDDRTFQYIEYQWPDAEGDYSNEMGGNFEYDTTDGVCLDDLLMYFQALQTETYVFPDVELPFATQAQAVQTALALFSSLGVDLAVDTVYPLDLTMLNKMQQDTKQNMDAEEGWKLNRKDEWHEEDECYYIRFEQMLEGLPVYDEYFWAYNGNGDSTEPPCLTAAISASGVESLDVSDLWTPTETREPETILSLEEILAVFSGQHNGLLGAKDVQVSRIALCYVPVGEEGNSITRTIRYMPAYVFTTSIDGESFVEVYSAYDGANLQWDY